LYNVVPVNDFKCSLFDHFAISVCLFVVVVRIANKNDNKSRVVLSCRYDHDITKCEYESDTTDNDTICSIRHSSYQCCTAALPVLYVNLASLQKQLTLSTCISLLVSQPVDVMQLLGTEFRWTDYSACLMLNVEICVDCS